MNEEEAVLAYKTAVPIDDIDYMLTSPTSGLAIVWIDTSDRPDLKTLGKPEPMPNGYSILSWFYNNPGKRNMQVCLRVQMKQPVQFAFSLIMPVQRYADQLTQISRHGHIWVVPGPPPDHLTGTQQMTMQDFMRKVVAYSGAGLLIALQPHLSAELRQQIADWKG